MKTTFSKQKLWKALLLLLCWQASSAFAQSTGLSCSDFDICGDELIANGDFELPDVLSTFDTEFRAYNNSGGYYLGECQTYTIGQNSHDVNPGYWFTLQNHTPGGSQFFIGDAQCTSHESLVWQNKAPIEVKEGGFYSYSAWVSNLDDASYFFNEPVFALKIQYVGESGFALISTHQIASSGGNWEELCTIFEAKQDGFVTVSITMLPSATWETLAGSDFGLDDISFKPASNVAPEILVANEEPCINDRVLVSAGEEPVLTNTYEWNFGSNGQVASQPGNNTSENHSEIVEFLTEGWHTITLTTTDLLSGCSSTDSKQIYVEECPPAVCEAVNQPCGVNLFPEGEGNFEGPNADDNITNHGDVEGSCGGHSKIITDSRPISGTDNNNSVYETETDHSGSGKFLYIDPPCLSSAQEIWKTNVTLDAESTYEVRAWFSNLSRFKNGTEANNNQPLVRFLLDGNPISTYEAIPFDENAKWIQLCAPVAGTGLSFISIQIAASSDATVASDLGVDDIELVPMSDADPTFDIAHSTGDVQYCAGDELGFNSNSINPAHEHEWDFGIAGEPVVTEVNPTKTFMDAGTYIVTHTVTDPITGCSRSQEVELDLQRCCGASVAWSSEDAVGSGLTDCEVQFTNSSQTDYPFAIMTYEWEFDDEEDAYDGTSSEEHPKYRFSSSGPHEACLTVSAKAGNEVCEVGPLCKPVEPNCIVSSCEIVADIRIELVHGGADYFQFIFHDESVTNEGEESMERTWTIPGEEPGYGNGEQEYSASPEGIPPAQFYAPFQVRLDVVGETKDGAANCVDSQCLLITPYTDGTYDVEEVDCAPVPPIVVNTDDPFAEPISVVEFMLGQIEKAKNGEEVPETISGLIQIHQNTARAHVYPNPTEGAFTLNLHGVTSQSVQVTVKNLHGQVVWNQQLSVTNSDVMQVQMSLKKEVGPGTYFISFDGTAEQIKPLKIVVMD